MFPSRQGKFQLICAKKPHLCESNKLCEAPTQPPHCAAHYLTSDILYRNIEQDCSESQHLVVMDCLSVSTASSLLPPVSFGLDHSDFSFCCPPFSPFLFFLALAEINRRYLTLMQEHNVPCSVETTFVSATGLSTLGNCAPLSCKAAWRYSCCRRGSEVGGRGEFGVMWKWKECVVLVCDTCGGLYD